MTLSLIITLSIMAQCGYVECRYTECHDAEFRK
jgi:hypothetical protein